MGRNHLLDLYQRLPKRVKKHTNKIIKSRPQDKGKKMVESRVKRILWGKKRR